MSELADVGRLLAKSHACDLLDRIGVSGAPSVPADHPALAWRRAGLMAITGHPDRRALVAPIALTAAADGALGALRMLAPEAPFPTSGAQLLGERARCLGFTRRGRISANGSCRLLATRDGDVAVNLSRPADWELLPAWLGEQVDSWNSVARIVARMNSEMVVERARLLGLAAASSGAVNAGTPFAVSTLGRPGVPTDCPLVVDLSSLWAGPLAGSLLQAAGARVIKVESKGRPDTIRNGPAYVFDLLNAGKASVELDFDNREDLRQLRRLIEQADIIIEATRPRALIALGVTAEDAVRGGATWISITAYGRAGEAGGWIGFGDDAAIAGGVSAAMERAWGEAIFAGDAIADPLTGITAALAALASLKRGGGRLITLALADVVAHACALHEVRDVRDWQQMAETDTGPLYPLRRSSHAASPLGSDTASILASLT